MSILLGAPKLKQYDLSMDGTALEGGSISVGANSGHWIAGNTLPIITLTLIVVVILLIYTGVLLDNKKKGPVFAIIIALFIVAIVRRRNFAVLVYE